MIHRSAFAVALFSLVGSLVAEARPIRTNSPGTGVFIGSGILLQTVCDHQTTRDADLSSCSLIGDFRYSPATHWVFGARLPLYVERQLDAGGIEFSNQGPGDLEVSAKWRFFRQVGAWFDRHAAIELGLGLPTGDSDVPAVPGLPPALAHRLSPSSGTTDAFVDLVYQQGQRRFVWGGDLLYRRHGAGERDFRRGDLWRLSLDAEYIAFPREYTKPGNEVFLLLETSLVHREDDELGGVDISSGGTEWLLAPGIQHIATDQMLVSLSLQLPIASDLGAAGLERRWNLLAEFRYAF